MPDPPKRPHVYTAVEAAVRVGVSRRTIWEWVRTGRLAPLNPDRSSARHGRYLFDGPSLTAAETSAKRGRARRKRSLP